MGERVDSDRVVTDAWRATPPGAPASGGREAAPPAAGIPPSGGEPREAEQMPRVRLTRGRLLGSVLFVVSAIAFLYLVLPKIVGLKDTWNRLQQGNIWWFAVAFVFELASFGGYVALFRAVFVDAGEEAGAGEPASRAREDPPSDASGGRFAPAERDGAGVAARLGWRASYEITMAGVAATRLFAAAGAGGIALTAWALRRSGMAPRTVACRMIAFLVLLYAVYMVALVVDGLGLYLGLFPGAAPFAATVVPAIFGAIVIVAFLVVSLLPPDFDHTVSRVMRRHSRLSSIVARIAAAPTAAAAGTRAAITLLAGRDPQLLGAPIWWGFDIATLWACFHAFGAHPHLGVIVMAYFIGMFGNTLPLPGGIGGVDGGMIGAFTAFGVDVETAIVAVLAYRAFAFWLPTVPGGIAYLQLRRTVSRWREETGGGDRPEAGPGHA